MTKTDESQQTQLMDGATSNTSTSDIYTPIKKRKKHLPYWRSKGLRHAPHAPQNDNLGEANESVRVRVSPESIPYLIDFYPIEQSGRRHKRV